MLRVRIVPCLLFVLAALFVSSASYGREPIKVIIDTDVAMGYKGHDVDDGLALLIALNSPELEIVGITASWGNHSQDKTCKKAKEIVEVTGNTHIPVHCGASGYRDLGKPTPASRFIAETVKADPGGITLLVIGTTTNVATAMMNDPEVAPAIKDIYSMGGTLSRKKHDWPYWAFLDLNYGANVKAARVLIDSDVPFHMAHSALCIETTITPERYERMVTTAPYMRDYLEEQTRSWFKLRFLVGPAPGIEGVVPWDVTALAMLLHPEWFEHNHVKGHIDHKGWGFKTVRIEDDNVPAEEADFNAPDTVIDKDAFWEWFFERI